MSKMATSDRMFGLLGVIVALASSCFGEPPVVPELSGTGGETGPMLDCSSIPMTAEGAMLSFTPLVMNPKEGASYQYSATGLPAGLTIGVQSGEISGVIEAVPGQYSFDVTILEVGADSQAETDTVTCDLLVRPRLSASLPVVTAPYCLWSGESLLDLLVDGTGDGTPIVCDFIDGIGNGRMPNGIEVDAEGCTITGAIDEDRYGTWVFAMRGVQSDAEVYVPFCATNDEDQGYEITAVQSGSTDAALLPVSRLYDPTADFTVGADMDPRYEIRAPGVCGASCFFKYSFVRTNAPLGEDGLSLEPDGLLQDNMGATEGFFHELRVSGPPVPAEFQRRPWVVSVTVSYCVADVDTGCVDAKDGDAALEMGVIMVPENG